ncbi:MAG: DUF748 domain-containing protein [Candidatus Omnitrophica bacterium]|nr:DUF748 domain-containing protein [Candidatus Omnitrophota bacterium]
MAKKSRIFFWILGIFLALFFAANILVGVFARSVIERRLQEALKLKCSLGKVGLSLPFTVNLERLEIGNLASIKKISLSPDPVALVFGKIVIHGLNIVDPVINIERSAEGKLNLPVSEGKLNLPAPEGKKSGPAPEFYLTGFNLVNGKVIFTDRKVSSEGFQLVLNKLDIKVSKVVLPLNSLAMNFQAHTEVLDGQSGISGDIDFSGWLDYPSRKMDAELEIKGLDLVKFSVYYGNFISQRQLAAGKLNLNSSFKAQNNILMIVSRLGISGLAYAETPQAQFKESLVKNTLDFFTDAKGNLNLEFSLKTFLDHPQFSKKEIETAILGAAAKNLARQSPQQIADKVGALIDQYKGMGKELKNIFGG